MMGVIGCRGGGRPAGGVPLLGGVPLGRVVQGRTSTAAFLVQPDSSVYSNHVAGPISAAETAGYTQEVAQRVSGGRAAGSWRESSRPWRVAHGGRTRVRGSLMWQP